MNVQKIANRIAGEYEQIYMNISYPSQMADDEVLLRAKALIPCDTGMWEEEDRGEGWMSGNMGCPPGFYDSEPDGAEYGPDGAGVVVEWETP